MSDSGASDDPPGPGGTGQPQGLRGALGAIAATLVAAIHTRVELATIEFAEERERTKRRLVLMLVVAIASAFALLAANALLVLALWDRWGAWTLVAIVAAHGLLAGWGAWRLAALAAREHRPFDATLAELERDRAWIAQRLGGRP